MKILPLAAISLGAAVFSLSSGRAREPVSPTPCEAGREHALPPSHDLYCMELTAVPGLEGVSAELELNRIPSPFGTNVNRDGAQVYAPLLRVSGLPDAGSFADGAAVWIAWLTTPVLDPVRKLGVVHNGNNSLPRIDWSKFLVLVTAERSAEAAAPEGRAALRGFSPSSRMQPPDMIEFLYGTAAPSRPEAAAAADEHAGHGARPVTAGPAVSWIHPPMPRGLAMMPAEMQLPPPAATAYLPMAPPGIVVPDVRPREIVRLGDGDTLVLSAGLVRQSVNGRSFVGYGYNGQVPGPLIWTAEGATVHVRYQNRIEWPATIHWHGVRLDNRFDGAAGVTQAPVPPGGEFDYTVYLRDAGLYWYHPHLREDVLKDLGLYGNLMVRPRHDEFGPANREEILMLDDLEVAEEGVVPYGAERTTHALMGRFGNVFLVNGRSDWSLNVGRGEVVRFFLTNVTNARTFNVSFGDARIKVLGSDMGGFEREEWVESVVVAPAERYIVDVRFTRPGVAVLENRVTAIDHTFGRFFEQVDTLGVVHVSDTPPAPDHGRAFDTLREHARVAADIERYRRHFDGPPHKQLAIRMQAQGLPFVVDRFLQFDSIYFHPVEWSGTMPMMNWNATSAEVQWILEEPQTGRRNMEIEWSFNVGDVVRVRIANLRETLHGMQHPIHFHGQRFLVVAQNGVRNNNLAWKDTFLLPAGNTADLLLEISNPGRWMAHCHVSEHLESGMMMTFSAH